MHGSHGEGGGWTGWSNRTEQSSLLVVAVSDLLVSSFCLLHSQNVHVVSLFNLFKDDSLLLLLAHVCVCVGGYIHHNTHAEVITS